MFNNQLFNTAQFNTRRVNPANEVISTNLVVFEGLSLSDNVICTVQEFDDSGSDVQILGGNVPRDDGYYTTDRYFGKKIITAEGYIKKNTAAELETFIDTFRKTLKKKNGTLRITKNDDSSTRREYVATVTNFHQMFSDREGYEVTICPFTVEFECRDPFAHDTKFSSVREDVTTLVHSIDVEQLGTIHDDPIYVIVIDSVDSITSINVKNVTTGYELSQDSTFASGDILRIDCINKNVTLNGAEVDYDGIFPFLETGTNTIQITSTGTSISFSATIKWRNSYI